MMDLCIPWYYTSIVNIPTMIFIVVLQLYFMKFKGINNMNNKKKLSEQSNTSINNMYITEFIDYCLTNVQVMPDMNMNINFPKGLLRIILDYAYGNDEKIKYGKIQKKREMETKLTQYNHETNKITRIVCVHLVSKVKLGKTHIKMQ